MKLRLPFENNRFLPSLQSRNTVHPENIKGSGSQETEPFDAFATMNSILNTFQLMVVRFCNTTMRCTEVIVTKSVEYVAGAGASCF